MKTSLVKLSLIAGGAMLAWPAFAQSPAQPGGTDATTAVKAPASTARLPAAPVTVAVNARAATAAPGTRTVSAEGGIIVLGDGIVANAAFAQIHPPAPGFVYER